MPKKTTTKEVMFKDKVASTLRTKEESRSPIFKNFNSTSTFAPAASIPRAEANAWNKPARLHQNVTLTEEDGSSTFCNFATQLEFDQSGCAFTGAPFEFMG